MSRLFANGPIKVHCLPGEIIDWALQDALTLSMQLEVEVLLEFNGKEIPCHYLDHTVQDCLEFYFKND